MGARRAKPPGLPHGKVRTAAQLLRNPDMLAHLSTFDQQRTDLLHWRVGFQRYFASRSPEHVEHVFIGGHERYRKATHYRLIAAVTGEGLLTAEGEDWARNRRLIQPIFAKRHLDALVPHMTAATADFLDRWQQRSEGDPLDVAAAMSEVTLDVVGRALFGATLSDAADRLRPAVVVGLRTGVAAARLQLLLALPRWMVDLGGWLLYNLPVLPPPLSRIREAMHTIDDVVRGVIDARSSVGGDADLLDLLLAARDENGETLSPTQVRDEVVTLVLAGHETTANGLAWLWYLLAQHPEARERMEDEVDTVLGDRTPTAADAERLVWTTACFQEAMRLYPPAWVLEREAVADDEIDGYRIPKRSTAIFPVFLIHRDPRWWPQPDVFDPTRFLGERAAQSHRGAYLPFGAGRRACVGANFALMEGTLIAAMVTQRFSLDLVDDARVQPEATVTLRPRHGLPMTVTVRASGQRSRGKPMDSIETMQRVIDESKRVVSNVTPDQLANKTTCTEWTVRDLINHITGGATMVGTSLEQGSVPDDMIGRVMSNADCLGDDYKGAFTAAVDRFASIMRQPGVLDKMVQLPFGTMPGEAALGFGIYDVSTHNCDIARATGQQVQDSEVLEAALALGRQTVQPEFRAPGIFDPEVDCGDDAPIADRLLAFGGRQV